MTNKMAEELLEMVFNGTADTAAYPFEFNEIQQDKFDLSIPMFNVCLIF